jgi:hypothetical protein
MSYTINKTDGSILTTLLDGTTNTDTGLTLIGRNYTSYGEIQNENFVRLLENFASTLPPGQSVGFTPLAGQLWWDTANSRLRVYNGADFVNVSEQAVGTSAPATPKIGDQWWDTTNKQLKVYDGSSWLLIAPPYTAAQGKSGAIVETLTDTTANTHTVVNTYTNGQLIAVTSYDPQFTVNTLAQFSTIRPGVNLASNVTMNGMSEDSRRLGGAWANAFPQTAQATTFTSDLSVVGNLRLTNANISFENSALVLKNTNLNGNVEMYVNSGVGNIKAFNINGSTGMITVYSNATSNFGLATKIYVDSLNNNTNLALLTNVAQLQADTTDLRTDIYGDLASNVTTLNVTINNLRSSTNANTAAIESALLSNVGILDSNIANKTARIESLENLIPFKANTASPVFTGSPTAPNAAPGTNSDRIATTAYVDGSTATLYSYIDAQDNTVANAASAALSSALSSKANIASPIFTGVPEAPTPASTDNSTKIATTGFVRGAITGNLTRWQGSRYTVSTSGPTGGDDGDFWFQIG